MYDKFAEPSPVKRVSPHEFRMAEAAMFFHTRRARVQLAGQRTIRGITTDVYIGLYPDPDKHRNFTVQWFISKAHWQVYAGASIESGALIRMEVYELASGNPTIYNVIEFENNAPDYDVFDTSPCYTPHQKIHFLLLVKGKNTLL
ncbi:EF-hand domain-containing protein D1 [Elysia marginata]|uniref:EF-hand domain-containing protein D1 n=1 Tax=Elysia marginata TaxID=1093978 RepID=A0AAV4IT14_9GAST|nr:EF-hand domain-containing protein D1 [Elysia marginata]